MYFINKKKYQNGQKFTNQLPEYTKKIIGNKKIPKSLQLNFNNEGWKSSFLEFST